MTNSDLVRNIVRRASFGGAFLAVATALTVGGSAAANAQPLDSCTGTVTTIGSNGAAAYCTSGSGYIRVYVVCDYNGAPGYVNGPWVWANAADPYSPVSKAYCPDGRARIGQNFDGGGRP